MYTNIDSIPWYEIKTTRHNLFTHIKITHMICLLLSHQEESSCKHLHIGDFIHRNRCMSEQTCAQIRTLQQLVIQQCRQFLVKLRRHIYYDVYVKISLIIVNLFIFILLCFHKISHVCTLSPPTWNMTIIPFVM